MDTSYCYQSAQVGEFRAALLYGSGPSSYAAAGDPVYNPGSSEYINFPASTLSKSGDYEVSFFPASTGFNQQRAGAPSSSQSGWTAIWKYSGKQGVVVVENAAGSGMTPGNKATITFSGGTGGGAAGYVTVLTATTIAITITASGSYTSDPTATVSSADTGGTAPTLTVTLAPSGGVVPVATDLSAESVQFQALISSL